jgi:hypothetical protein
LQRLDEPLADFLGKGARNSNALTVVIWGYTKRVILDEMDKLIDEGKMIRFVKWPYYIHFHPEGSEP